MNLTYKDTTKDQTVKNYYHSLGQINYVYLLGLMNIFIVYYERVILYSEDLALVWLTQVAVVVTLKFDIVMLKLYIKTKLMYLCEKKKEK